MLTPHSFAFYLWSSVVVAHCILAFAIWRWNAAADYPWFARFVYFQTFATAMGFLCATLFGGWPYFITYYALTLTGNLLLIFFVAREAYVLVFGPRISFPSWIYGRLMTYICMGIGTAILLNIVWRAQNGGRWTRTLVTAEQGLTVSAWVIFAILWIYSRSLSMSWKPRLSGITTGFFIYLSVSVSAVFVRARWPLAAAAIAGRVGMCSYLVAVLVWVTVLWGPAPEEKPATEAMMHELEQHHRENMNAVDILRSAIR